MPDRPNILYVIVDNQSAWTLGCHGNTEIATPNIDRLAAGGVRFERAFCVNPVCSPNRATNLTGLVPSQHGVHSWLGREQPDAQVGPDAYCTIEEFTSLPAMLAREGYRCGLSGKWHLGDSLRPQLGFSYWFTMPRGHTHSFRGMEAVWHGETYTEPCHFVEATADHALDFLRTGGDEPFFLYVGFNGPYGLDNDLRTGDPLSRHIARYADAPMLCCPRGPMHPWLRQYRDIYASDDARRRYAAAITCVDEGLGRLLDELDAQGVAEDTLVIFTADHGLCAGHHGVWGMGDHSVPRHMFQPNMHVPLVFRHRARMPAGAVCGRMVCHYDLLPSLCEHLDLGGPEDGLPRAGRSYAAALEGGPMPAWEEIVFHEYGEVRAVQTPDWKLVLRHPDGPDELYRIGEDPGEWVNLTGSDEGADAEAELRGRLAEFFARYSKPQYDVWRGGRSKAGPLAP